MNAKAVLYGSVLAIAVLSPAFLASVQRTARAQDPASHDLRNFIKQLRDPFLRFSWSAGTALAKLGEAALLPLVEACKEGRTDVRRNAAWALGELNGDKAVKPLRELMAHDRDGIVRILAARGLHKRSADEAALALLLESLGNDDETHRSNAAWALGTSKEKKAVDALRKVWMEDREEGVRVFGAFGVFMAAGDEKALRFLIEACGDENPERVAGAVLLLGETGDARAVGPLAKAMRTGDRLSSSLAADGLTKIGKPAVETLVRALKDENKYVRYFVAVALGRIRDARAIEPLFRALKDGYRNARRAAGQGLIGFGKSVLERMLKALEDTDWEIRSFAARALGKIGEKTAVVPLIRALKEDENRDVRDCASDALGLLGDASAVEPLVQAMKEDRETSVRCSASGALGLIGHAGAVPALIAMLKDPDACLRYHCARALGEIGDEAALRPLVEALKDEDPSVRSHAVEALEKMTKQKFGSDIEKWKKWLVENR